MFAVNEFDTLIDMYIEQLESELTQDEPLFSDEELQFI